MRRFFVAILAICLSSSAMFVASASEPPNADAMARYEDFEASIAAYPYAAPPERAAKVRTGAAELRRCMSRARVAELIGAPDFSQLVSGPKGPGEKALGSSWTYYLSKRSSSANEFDARVEVFFDTTDRLHAAAIRGVPGVADLTAPQNDLCS